MFSRGSPTAPSSPTKGSFDNSNMNPIMTRDVMWMGIWNNLVKQSHDEFIGRLQRVDLDDLTKDANDTERGIPELLLLLAIHFKHPKLNGNIKPMGNYLQTILLKACAQKRKNGEMSQDVFYDKVQNVLDGMKELLTQESGSNDGDDERLVASFQSIHI